MPSSDRLTFPNADGHTLSARLDRPDGAPVAYALFAHCFTCSKDLHAVRRIGRALTDRGIAVLSFDFTGLGQSEGDFGDTSFTTTVTDLVRAAEHLAAREEAPQILIGHSLGGAAVLAAAEHVPSALAVATIGAPCDPAHVRHLFTHAEAAIEARGEAEVSIGGRPFCIRKQFLDDLRSHEAMRERIGRLGRALLVFHAPQDQIVGIEQARHIYEAAKHPKSFVSLDGADHLLTDADDAHYVAEVLAAWSSRYLAPPGAPAAGAAPPGEAPSLYEDPTVTAVTGDGFRTALLARGFALVADEPSSVGGTESGPTPYDYLSAALAACTSMTLRMYADRKGWPLETVTVRVAHARVHAQDCATCETEEGHVDQLTRQVEVTGALDPEQRARLIEIADRCPVHRTLHGEVHVQTEAPPAPDASP
ncbi:MAG: alpha/beta fold hydrolase [Rubricoccaceae bacterium]|nr:alpha/beta fold hydrolase [Rubricoccaceae bacterium]